MAAQWNYQNTLDDWVFYTRYDFHHDLPNSVNDLILDVRRRLEGTPAAREAREINLMPDINWNNNNNPLHFTNARIYELAENAIGALNIRALLFNYTESIHDKFKKWEMSVCLPNKGLNVGNLEWWNIMAGNQELPVRYSSTYVNIDRRLRERHDFDEMNLMGCINAQDQETGEYSNYGCGYNVLAFLNIIRVDQCQENVQNMHNNNNNNGAGLHTNDMINLINIRLRNFVRRYGRGEVGNIQRQYIPFNVRQIDGLIQTNDYIYTARQGGNGLIRTQADYDSIVNSIKHLWILLLLTIIYKTLMAGGANGGSNCAMLVKQVMEENGLGHTVIYTLNDEGRLISCDPQKGKWHRLITNRGITGLARFLGISILHNQDQRGGNKKGKTIKRKTKTKKTHKKGGKSVEDAAKFSKENIKKLNPNKVDYMKDNLPMFVGNNSKTISKTNKSNKNIKKLNPNKEKYQKDNFQMFVGDNSKTTNKNVSPKKVKKPTIFKFKETHDLGQIKDIDDISDKEVEEYYASVRNGFKLLGMLANESK